MSKSDLDAVAARREAIGRRLTTLQTARMALDAEHKELELTERVLNRLADYFVAKPISQAPSSGADRSIGGNSLDWFGKAVTRGAGLAYGARRSVQSAVGRLSTKRN